MLRYIATFLLLLPNWAQSQVPFPELPQPVAVFSNEAKDWGIASTTTVKRPPLHAPTPLSIPGGRVIKTLELKALLEANPSVVVVDVLDSKSRYTVPGAHWMVGAGDHRFFAAEKAKFAAAIGKLLGDDKTRPVVFLCVSSECWISYNAALHAIEAGFKDVIWFRGGTESWKGANLDLKVPASVSW